MMEIVLGVIVVMVLGILWAGRRPQVRPDRRGIPGLSSQGFGTEPGRKVRSFTTKNTDAQCSTSHQVLAGSRSGVLWAVRLQASAQASRDLEEFCEVLRRSVALCAAGVDMRRALQVTVNQHDHSQSTLKNCEQQRGVSQPWQQLATLLNAGYDTAEACHTVACQVSSRNSVLYRAPCVQQAWQLLLLVVAVSQRQGSPISALLQALHDEVSVDIEQRRVRKVSLSGPLTTALVLICMPLAAATLGRTLGVDTLSFLTGSVIGMCCALVSLLFLAIGLGGSWWLAGKFKIRSDSQGGNPSDSCVALIYEVIAAGAATGTSDDTALRYVLAVIANQSFSPWRKLADDLRTLLRGRGYGLCWAECQSQVTVDGLRSLCAVLATCEATGAPVTSLARQEAKAYRERVLFETSQRSELLGTMLCIPISLGLLPMFFGVGLVPIALELLRQVSH